MFFVRAYPRETQEMVFDAHDLAFAFFKGTSHAPAPPAHLKRAKRARGALLFRYLDKQHHAAERSFLGADQGSHLRAV